MTGAGDRRGEVVATATATATPASTTAPIGLRRWVAVVLAPQGHLKASGWNPVVRDRATHCANLWDCKVDVEGSSFTGANGDVRHGAIAIAIAIANGVGVAHRTQWVAGRREAHVGVATQRPIARRHRLLATAGCGVNFLRARGHCRWVASRSGSNPGVTLRRRVNRHLAPTGKPVARPTRVLADRARQQGQACQNSRFSRANMQVLPISPDVENWTQSPIQENCRVECNLFLHSLVGAKWIGAPGRCTASRRRIKGREHGCERRRCPDRCIGFTVDGSGAGKIDTAVVYPGRCPGALSLNVHGVPKCSEPACSRRNCTDESSSNCLCSRPS